MGNLKMMTMRIWILTILIFFCSTTLFTEDLFYYQSGDNSEWMKVTAWKGRQVEGFVHKSRIQEFEKLDSKKQKELILKTLDKQRILANNFKNALKTKDNLAYRKTVRELEFHSDTKYDPILKILPKFFCLTSDSEVLGLFIATMLADKGSANEMPSFSIGVSFICNPNLVIEQLTKVKNKEYRKSIFDHIEWGLLNHFDVDENGKSDNKEFNKLKARLDNERKKDSP